MNCLLPTSTTNDYLSCGLSPAVEHFLFEYDDWWEHPYLARQTTKRQMQTWQYPNGIKMKVSTEEGLLCSVICTITEQRVLVCASS